MFNVQIYGINPYLPSKMPITTLLFCSFIRKSAKKQSTYEVFLYICNKIISVIIMKRSLFYFLLIILLCYCVPVSPQLILTEKELSDTIVTYTLTGEQLADSVLLYDSLANYYDQIGNHMLALEYAGKNVALNSLHGKTTVPYAVSLLKLARYVYPSERDYDKELSNRGLSILKDSLGVKSSTYTKYLLEYAWRQFDYGLIQESCNILKAAAEDSYNGDEFYLGYLYYSYAHFLSRIDDNDKALLYANKAESFFIGKEMWADDYYPQTLIDLALLCAPDIEESEVYLNKAKDVIERYKGKESLDYLNVILDFSSSYKAVGQFDKALEYAQQAKDVGEKIKGIDNSSYIYTLEYLAKIYSDLKQYNEAIFYAEECLSLIKEDKEISIDDRLPILDSLIVYHMTLYNEEGSSLPNISGIEEKIKLYAQEAYLIRRNLNISGEEMWKNIYFLIQCNFRLGRYKECEENIRELRSIIGESFSSGYKHYYDVMATLAQSYLARKKYKESLDVTKETYSSYVKQFGENGVLLPDLINFQALIYARLGDFDNFYEYSIKALEGFKNVYGENSVIYLKEMSKIASNFFNMGVVDKAYEMYRRGAELAQAIYGRNHQLFTTNYINAMLLWNNDRTQFIDDYNFEDYFRYLKFYNILYSINNNSMVNYPIVMGKIKNTLFAVLPNLLQKYENESTAYKAIYNCLLFQKSQTPNIEELKSKIIEELGDESKPFYDLSKVNTEYIKYNMKLDPIIVDSLYNKSIDFIDQLSKESSSFKLFYEGKMNVDKIKSNLLDNEIVVDYVPLKKYGENYNDYLVVLGKNRECPDFIPVSDASEQIKQICSAYDTSFIFINNDSILSCLNLDYSKSNIVGYDLSVDYLINRGHNKSDQIPAHQTLNQNHLDPFASAYSEFERGVNLYNKKQYEEAMSAFFQSDSLMFVAKGENSNYFGHGKQWIASCLHKLDRDSIARMYSQYYYLQPVDMRQTALSDSVLDVANKLYDDGFKKDALEKLYEASQIEKNNVGEKSYWYANTLSRCAEICNEIEEYDRAIILETEAINIRKVTPGIDHIDYYWSLENLYNSSIGLGNIKDIINNGEILIKYMEEHKKAIGWQYNFYTHYTSVIARLAAIDNDSTKALFYCNKALETIESQIDIPNYYTQSYYDIIFALNKIGEDSLVFELCNKIIPFFENIQNKDIETTNSYSNILIILSNHYYDQGDYITASLLLERVMEKAKEKGNTNYGLALSNLAALYRELGRTDEAIDLSIEAVNLCDSTENSSAYADRLINLAQCYYRANRIKDALRIGKMCYNFLIEKFGFENSYTMVAANNLAAYYNDLGYYEEYRNLLSVVVEHAEKDMQRNGEILGTVYNNLAMDWNRKDFDMHESLQYVNKSYEIRKKVYGEKDLRTIQSLYNRGRCLLEIGDISEGTICITKALDQTKGIIVGC